MAETKVPRIHFVLTESIIKRFLAKYVPAGPDECWIWKGAPRGNGYGCMKIDGHVVSAHRIAYEIANGAGSIPDDMVVDHVRCDTRPCVNPAHLEPKTSWANTLRATKPNPVVIAARSGQSSLCKKGHPLVRSVRPSGRTRGRCRACSSERERLRRVSLTQSEKECAARIRREKRAIKRCPTVGPAARR